LVVIKILFRGQNGSLDHSASIPFLFNFSIPGDHQARRKASRKIRIKLVPAKPEATEHVTHPEVRMPRENSKLGMRGGFSTSFFLLRLSIRGWLRKGIEKPGGEDTGVVMGMLKAVKNPEEVLIMVLSVAGVSEQWGASR
jgi:hypothetical protein